MIDRIETAARAAGNELVGSNGQRWICIGNLATADTHSLMLVGSIGKIAHRRYEHDWSKKVCVPGNMRKKHMPSA